MTRQVAVRLDIDDKGFIFDTGLTFRGLTISEAPGGWNCVLRAREKSGAPVYAMTTATEPAEGLAKLYEAVSHGKGERLWRHDRFATS